MTHPTNPERHIWDARFGHSDRRLPRHPAGCRSSWDGDFTVTSYGYTSNCCYIDGLQRVDIGIA